MKHLLKVLYVPAGVIGICLIPFAMIPVSRELWYTAKDIYGGWVNNG